MAKPIELSIRKITKYEEEFQWFRKQAVNVASLFCNKRKKEKMRAVRSVIGHCFKYKNKQKSMCDCRRPKLINTEKLIAYLRFMRQRQRLQNLESGKYIIMTWHNSKLFSFSGSSPEINRWTPKYIRVSPLPLWYLQTCLHKPAAQLLPWAGVARSCVFSLYEESTRMAFAAQSRLLQHCLIELGVQIHYVVLPAVLPPWNSDK